MRLSVWSPPHLLPNPFCYPKPTIIRLELQPEVEAQLAAEALARGVALDRYVAAIVQNHLPEQPKTNSISEAIQRILELREDSDLRGLNPKELINEGRRF